MATMKQIFGNMKKGLSTGNFTLNGLVQTLQHYCEDLENSTGGGGGGSTVEYSQTATSGGECGTITIDGTAKKIYAPLQNAGGVGYNNTSSGLTADDVQEAIDELNTKEGDLTDLTTTAKTSLVAAINEVAQGGGGSTAWTVIGTKTGNNPVTVDSANYNEFLVLVQLSGASKFTHYLPSDCVANHTGYYGGGEPGGSGGEIYAINVTATAINLSAAFVNNSNVLNASSITVYGR